MKVLTFASEDRHCGQTRRIFEIAREIEPLGISTECVFPLGNGEATKVAEAYGLKAFHGPYSRPPSPRRVIAMGHWARTLPERVRKLADFISDHAPDVVHVNTAYLPDVMWAARRARLPVLCHLTDTLLPKPAALVAGRIIAANADVIAAPALAVMRHHGFTPDPACVIYPPVAAHDFDRRRKSVFPPDGKFRVGIIANWNPNKRIETFVRAIALARTEHECDVVPVTIGARLDSQQAYAASIEKLISDLGLANIHEDLGFRDDTVDVVSELDILVLCSKSEGCPVSIMEAMMAGTPVIATDVGGVREQLARTDFPPAGVIVSPHKAEHAIACAIRELRRDHALRTRLGQSGKEISRQTFSIQAAAERQVMLYRTAVSRSPETRR